MTFEQVLKRFNIGQLSGDKPSFGFTIPVRLYHGEVSSLLLTSNLRQIATRHNLSLSLLAQMPLAQTQVQPSANISNSRC